ncbi:hypothetical protein YERSI8AC_40149 [Enterobacterales bacterium 8AC]|nr:hypothetical protein YERSI8AC_40149 [Enterobacterales bacterium 8AC]
MPQLALSISQRVCYYDSVIKLYPSHFQLLGCWLPSLTPATYLSKLLGIISVAAYKQLELFWV